MKRNGHTLRYTLGVALLITLGAAILVGWPYLLSGHHHPDFEQATHCAVCIFASGHVVTAPIALDHTVTLAAIGRIQCSDDPTLASLPSHTPLGRSPPTA